MCMCGGTSITMGRHCGMWCAREIRGVRVYKAGRRPGRNISPSLLALLKSLSPVPIVTCCIQCREICVTCQLEDVFHENINVRFRYRVYQHTTVDSCTRTAGGKRSTHAIRIQIRRRRPREAPVLRCQRSGRRPRQSSRRIQGVIT